MTERDPKLARDPAGSAPAQPTEKAFDPGHLGRHTMPIELRLELMTAELPRLAEEDLYHSPRSNAPAVPQGLPDAAASVEGAKHGPRKTRRRIGFSILIGFSLLAAMIGVVLLRAPRLGPQRVSPTSAILRPASVHAPSPSGTGSSTRPAPNAPNAPNAPDTQP